MGKQACILIPIRFPSNTGVISPPFLFPSYYVNGRDTSLEDFLNPDILDTLSVKISEVLEVTLTRSHTCGWTQSCQVFGLTRCSWFRSFIRCLLGSRCGWERPARPTGEEPRGCRTHSLQDSCEFMLMAAEAVRPLASAFNHSPLAFNHTLNTFWFRLKSSVSSTCAAERTCSLPNRKPSGLWVLALCIMKFSDWPQSRPAATPQPQQRVGEHQVSAGGWTSWAWPPRWAWRWWWGRYSLALGVITWSTTTWILCRWEFRLL